MSGGKRPGAGRKATPIDLFELERVCALHCVDEEIAAWFRISLRTLQTRRKQPAFAESMRRGRARGSISIRNAQFKLLERGSATMAVWLGKTVLGQKDTMQITGADGGPVQTESRMDFSRLSVDELRLLRAAMAKAKGKEAV
jgi:hypothetical protein